MEQTTKKEETEKIGRLTHYLKCTAKIKLLSGMLVGGQKEGIGIGGIDSPVIKNPITNMPYLPGSTLKGRFRMALELKYNDTHTETNGEGPSTDPENDSLVVKMFGSGSPGNKDAEPTRCIFRDCYFSAGFEEFSHCEEKTEVKMDRYGLNAMKKGNRTSERIPAGAQFDFELMIRIFEKDKEEDFISRLKEAIHILQLEYLGGSGTRGYGKVEFVDLQCEKINL